MSTRLFPAMNTDWWIGTADEIELAPMETAVHEAEQRYSRFRTDSVLSRLNRERAVRDAGLASLVARALALYEATDGGFDVRVGASVQAAGYDRSFELVTAAMRSPRLRFAPPVTALSVEVLDEWVVLNGDGTVDLGGIAKGWTVDLVCELIERAGCRNYLVDGGGDIRARGYDERGEPWLVGAGEGLVVRPDRGAVCTSSTRRRRWWADGEDAHHIIDPATGAPSRHAIVEAVVVASDATTADALATTLIAQPEQGLASLAQCGAEALFLRDGAWEITQGMQRWLA